MTRVSVTSSFTTFVSASSPVSIQTQSLTLRALRFDGNRAKCKRLRWQAANHGCHCFDRASYWLLRLARYPSKRNACNARNASDCVWMETGLQFVTSCLGYILLGHYKLVAFFARYSDLLVVNRANFKPHLKPVDFEANDRDETETSSFLSETETIVTKVFVLGGSDWVWSRKLDTMC